MVEACLAWICVIFGAILQNPTYLIASALFAIAAQMYLTRSEKGGKHK